MSHARPTRRWDGTGDALAADGPVMTQSLSSGALSHGTLYSDPAERPGLLPGRGIFRRSAIAPRRRRSRPLAIAGRWLARLALVAVLPAAIGVWLLTSPRFALSELAVTGSERVPAQWIEGSLAPLSGRNLVRLPLASVEQKLAGHPWVAEVAIRKELPATLRVVIEQRRPAALVSLGEQAWYADAEGLLIAPLADGEEPDALLVVRPAAADAPAEPAAGMLISQVPAALAVADEMAREQPLWAAGLIAVEALNDEDFVIETAALPFALRVRAGALTLRGQPLRELLPRIERRFGFDGNGQTAGAEHHPIVADLRFSRRIVLESLTVRPPQHGAVSDL
jgi:hypothetical protein